MDGISWGQTGWLSALVLFSVRGPQACPLPDSWPAAACSNDGSEDLDPAGDEGATDEGSVPLDGAATSVEAGSEMSGDGALTDARGLADTGSSPSRCDEIPPTSFALQDVACTDKTVSIYADNPFVSRADTDSAYAMMPPVEYTPTGDRFANLPNFLKRLCCKDDIHVVMLGDSIINNTSHSRWEEYLSEQTGAHITKITAVRGSTGSLSYAEQPLTYCSALRHQPDLLILGGISEIDIPSLTSIIQQSRAVTDAEVLLLTPVFGLSNPSDPKTWTYEVDPNGNTQRAQLQKLAQDQKVGFFDIAAPWGQYILNSGRTLDSYKTDAIHGNVQGEQILGRLLTAQFNPSTGGQNLCASISP